jgi:hypothetical protein
MNEQSPNPLLERLKLPGRTFQLPSRGALYRDGELASQEGEVHVHALSAIAEINLKNPDLLFNGKAIQEVFAECVPEIKRSTELYGRDVDAVMFFLRLVTYGADFPINVKHTCENAKDHSYTVNLETLLQQMKFLDPTQIEKDFTAIMPNGQIVKVHPIKFSHMIKLFQMNSGKEEFTPDDQKANLIFNLTNVIESVDGLTDRKLIEEWVRKVSTPFHNRITEAIEKTNQWGPASTIELKCKDCGSMMNVDLPLNPASFFTE